MQNILIVDDDPNIAMLVQLALSANPDYATTIINDGNEAIESIKNNHPDVILLDVMMPGISGFEICKRVKSDEATKYIPVILITAKTDTADKIHGMDIGANDYITKPFNPDELLARIKALLRIKDLERELGQKAELGAALKTSVTLQHEVNNPLTAIIGNLELLQDRSDMDEDEVDEIIKELLGLSFRIRDIVIKMNGITRFVSKTYIEGSEMLDVEESTTSKSSAS